MSTVLSMDRVPDSLAAPSPGRPATGSDGDGGAHNSRTAWLALFGVGVAVVTGAQLLPAGVGRAILVLPMLVIVPGLTLLRVILGRSHPDTLTTLGIFSVVLSLALLIADALLLTTLGIKLSTGSLGLGALVSTGVLTCVAMARGLPLLPEPMRQEWVEILKQARRISVLGPATAVLVAIVVVVGTVAIVAHRLPGPTSRPYTDLSLGRPVADLGSSLVTAGGTPIAIPVVAQSHREPPGPYTLTASVDGRVVSSQSIHLAASGTWAGNVNVITPGGSGLHRVTITLSETGNVNPAAPDELAVYLHSTSGPR